MAAVSFALDTNFKSAKADKIKRIQIHVAEAQGLSLKGSAKSPSAYVTVESPGFGTLHQTSSVGKGKGLIWHENTRIVELKPSAPIKFTVRRQAIWPMTNHVLGSTDTYDINKLIEMQGKNDREASVTLSLKNLGTGAQTKPSIIVNIRDLDTREDLQQVREYAAYAASSKRNGKQRETDCSSMSDESHSPSSARSFDSPMTGTSSAFSSFSPSSSPPTSPPTSPSIRQYSPPGTADAAAAASVMSTAVASPVTTPTTTSSSHVAADSTAMQESITD